MVDKSVLQLHVNCVRQILFSKVDYTSEMMIDRIRMSAAIKERYQHINEHMMILEKERRTGEAERQRVRIELNDSLDRVKLLRFRYASGYLRIAAVYSVIHITNVCLQTSLNSKSQEGWLFQVRHVIAPLYLWTLRRYRNPVVNIIISIIKDESIQNYVTKTMKDF